MPSIGSATGSRVDSAAKHIMACKVDTRALQNWMDNASNVYDKENQLHTNKMKWCMHKDEIVLNTTRKKDQSDACAKAYPMVVTTLGDIHTNTMEYMKVLYAQQSAYDFYTVWKNNTWNSFCDCTSRLSSLQSDNTRKSKDIYMDQRLYGGNSGIGKSSGLKQTDKVVRIKSYRMCRSPSNGTTASVMPQSDHYGDKSRVFAKCISGGRAFDAVDIMLMTQSS